MTDHYDEGDREQRPEPTWVYLTDPNRHLRTFCCAVGGCVIAACILTDILTP